MDYAVTLYNNKKIFSGHFPKHDGKITRMVKDLEKYGWCFPPIPVVDLGAYFQALDGSHRIEACKRSKQCPEIIVIDARFHPDQPIPKGWEEIINAPLVFGKIIRGFGLKPNIQNNHIGIVLDRERKILRVEYVKVLFNLLLDLGHQASIIKEEINGPTS